MKRREFVEKLGIGSAALVSGPALAGSLAAPELTAQQEAQGEHDHRAVTGPLANATVSFGYWKTGPLPAEPPLPALPPLDRYPATPPNPRYNGHLLIPFVSSIRAGGTVNFVISGLHNPAVYAHGTKPEDIDTTLVRAMALPPGLPLINDPNNRLYVGPDPSRHPLDRVEVVGFPNPGLYLVICAFLFHFQDNMFGFVRVLPSR